MNSQPMKVPTAGAAALGYLRWHMEDADNELGDLRGKIQAQILEVESGISSPQVTAVLRVNWTTKHGAKGRPKQVVDDTCRALKVWLTEVMCTGRSEFDRTVEVQAGQPTFIGHEFAVRIRLF